MTPLIEDKKEELFTLCRQYGVRRLELFGSAARGTFAPATSDLDFLVDYDPAWTGSRGDSYFNLWFGLEDLFGREVDLSWRPRSATRTSCEPLPGIASCSMGREALKHLWDMEAAASHALAFVEGRSLADYLTDELMRAGVERKLTIVGEAMVRLRGTDPGILAQITDCRRIIGFRNLVVHGSDAIDAEAVWAILHENVPILVSEIEALRRLNPDPD